ncbi:hypothetical protein BJ322DRAFT_1059306 [Thelephora terrestris]|uniref:Uncharacterized protein n=1 Tax=Thelephora terrestris TaxID=56493 RepID=A0A9P6HGP8_9AGAM|nr:hypothetical protein BJ322DRAFT_1096881 [Thelephora terrestris]KAF9786387.1 hypothetical protein BJ322DRAFT_1059306 [Thelephora terrestris]
MAFVQRFWFPGLPPHPTDIVLSYLIFLSPAGSSPFTPSFKMADASIFYMFSSRTPYLGEKLQQRDRLIDSQVYLKIINRKEVRTVVNRVGPNPCSSTTLLLASLLRPRSHQFPLHFRLEALDTPHLFYTFDFTSRHLPPPPGDSFGFSVLFALPIQSNSVVFVQLAQFVLRVSADISAVSGGLKLWDLTFRIDHNHVFGTLQFETRDRHEKIQMEGNFLSSSYISLDPDTNDAVFYRELGGDSLPSRAVSTHMQQINDSLRHVLSLCSTQYILLLNLWTGT